MIASPRDLEGLDVERERQRVEEAVASLQRDGLVAVTWLAGQTWRDLLRAMRGGPWHIFHFIGHGGFDPQADEGVLALADDAGRSRLLTATELGMLLADHHPLRLALLNACESAQGSETDLFASTAATLIRRGLPAALAMQYEITDRAAIEFARTFYETLAEGRPVGMAVAEARKAISLAVANTLEWGTPVLYLRSPDDILFRTIERPVPSSPPPRPRRPATTRETPRTKEKGRGERATAVTDRIPESLTGNDGAEMVLVPSGEFWMGSEDKDADPDERPRHRMFLNAFYIDKFPVTNAQYRAFVAATGHDEPEFWTHPGFEGTNQPVVGVSWEDARAYCRWAAKRLPTEAEWEKAARGTEGQKYPWGEEWDPTRANSNDGGPGKPTAVGSYLTGVSPYGAHDMAGNVYEWTASQYRAYPYQADDGREDPASRGSRVIRGGSWAYDPRFLRVSCRNDTTPTNCNGGLGFRCARDVSP
jgi:formylglycine-generating enzyme required for sulfatase activity